MDPQIKVYTENRGRYFQHSNLLALALRHSSKPCVGPACDIGSPCKRHLRTTTLLNRIGKQRVTL
jgi:hypothetical protein